MEPEKSFSNQRKRRKPGRFSSIPVPVLISLEGTFKRLLPGKLITGSLFGIMT